MPPKAKITKENIIDCAFAMIQSGGFHDITTRKLAKELACSTQPIYHLFSDMEDLKKALYVKSCRYFTEQVHREMPGLAPDFLEMGIAYIKAAKREKNVFHFMCTENNFSMHSMMDLVAGADESLVSKDVSGISGLEGFTKDQLKELFMLVWTFTHGIATIASNDGVTLSDEELSALLIKAYKAFVMVEGSPAEQ